MVESRPALNRVLAADPRSLGGHREGCRSLEDHLYSTPLEEVRKTGTCMKARFRVTDDAFDLASKRMLAFRGEVEDGNPSPGMFVRLPSGASHSVTRRVDGVGLLCDPGVTPCRMQIGFIYQSAAERDVLRVAFPAGSVMELSS